MRGARSIVFLEVGLSGQGTRWEHVQSRGLPVFRVKGEKLIQRAYYLRTASPSAVAEQANSALEPTALRAAAQRPSR